MDSISWVPLGVAIPLPRRAARKRFAQIAQLVEQGTENPRVGSSILSLGTRESKGLQRKLQAFFRYGLLPDARLRIAVRGRLLSGGPSRSSSFFPRLFLRPVFVPVRGTVPGVTGGFPMPIRAFIRTGWAPEQHTACRISG